jgi:hypothetical protein
VPKRFGEEFPERELMSVLSDLLAIPHFTTARGSTVRKDFLDAVAGALGVDGADRLLKDQVLAAAVEAATQHPMPDDLYSPGGTVTNQALQAIVDGVIRNGRPGGPAPAAVEEAAPAFDPALVTDERDRRLLELAVRQGQDRFRAMVVEAYDARCAVTGFDAVEALEAAHITPYKGPATSLVSNGILLRADVHALWDRGSLAVHETAHTVLVKPHLRATAYRDLADAPVDHLPRRLADRPAVVALRDHRQWCGL